MDTHQEHTRQSNGEVLIAASVAAGAIGGSVALLNEARKHFGSSSNAKEVTKAEIDQSANQLRDSSATITDVARENLPILSRAARDKASAKWDRVSDQAGSVREQMKSKIDDHGPDVSAGLEQARDAVKHARESLADTTNQAKKRARKVNNDLIKDMKKSNISLDAFSQSGRELGEKLRKRLPESTDSVSERVAPKLADFRQQAESTLSGALEASRTHAPKLKELGKHASDVAASAAVSGREHAPELKALVDEHLVPKLQDVRQRAASLASDKHVPDGIVPDLKHSADDLAKRFADSLGTAERSFSDLRGNASHAVDSVGSQARVVRKNASDGSKNAGAALVWTGVAAGVVYVGLLTPEQREWVKQKANRVYGSAKTAVADVRGRDGDFRATDVTGDSVSAQ